MMQYDLTLCPGEGCPQKENCMRAALAPLGRQDFFGDILFDFSTQSCEFFMQCYRIDNLFLYELKTMPENAAADPGLVEIELRNKNQVEKYALRRGAMFRWKTDWGAEYCYLKAGNDTEIISPTGQTAGIAPGIYAYRPIVDVKLR